MKQGGGATAPRLHRLRRSYSRPPNPAGFLFAFVGCRLLLLILRFQRLSFARVLRSEEFGGPPLFEPSLKMERNTGHITASGLSPWAHRGFNARGPSKVLPVRGTRVHGGGFMLAVMNFVGRATAARPLPNLWKLLVW